MIHHYPCSEKSEAHLGQHGHRSFENSQRESQFFLSPPLHPPLTSFPSESEFNPRIVSFHPQYLLSCPSGTVSQKPFCQAALRSHQMGEHHVNILLHDRLILCLWKHFDEFDGPRTNYLFILFNLQPMYFFCYIVCFQTISKHGGIRSVDQVIRWKITNTLNLTQIPSFDLQDFLPSSKCNDQETDACSSLVFSQPIHQEGFPLRWRSS